MSWSGVASCGGAVSRSGAVLLEIYCINWHLKNCSVLYRRICFVIFSTDNSSIQNFDPNPTALYFARSLQGCLTK